MFLAAGCRLWRRTWPMSQYPGSAPARPRRPGHTLIRLGGTRPYDFSRSPGPARRRCASASPSRRRQRTRIVSATQALGLGCPDGAMTAITCGPAARLRLIFDRSLRPIVTWSRPSIIAKGRITGRGGGFAIGCAYAAPLDGDTCLGRTVLPQRIGAPLAGAGLRRRSTAGSARMLTIIIATSRYSPGGINRGPDAPQVGGPRAA